jgi:hypothetical protein
MRPDAGQEVAYESVEGDKVSVYKIRVKARRAATRGAAKDLGGQGRPAEDPRGEPAAVVA